METRILLNLCIFFLLFYSCEKDDNGNSESGNKAPLLSDISNQTVSAGYAKNVQLSATDPDGDSLSFSISTNPGFLTITNSSQTGDTATATLVLDPDNDVKGDFTAAIQVSDGKGGKDNKNFMIEVTEPSFELSDYFPIEKGTKWTYSVNFPANCEVPYSPWFEYPDGLLGTSLTHGMGSWSKGQINFEILVNDVVETTSNSTTWDVSLSNTGQKFYFYSTSFHSIHLQLVIDNENADLNIIGEMDMDPPRWLIARALARLTSADLSQNHSISVPAGDFSNCVKSTVNIYGDGTYVPSGKYPVEIFLAPYAGIVKATGKAKDGTVLYTLELTQNSSGNSGNGGNDNSGDEGICVEFDAYCGDGTFFVCFSDSSLTNAYYLYNGKRYDCDGDDCTEAAEELVKDMCGY